MKVFLIEGDEGEDRIVEASCMAEAIGLWGIAMRASGCEEPEPTAVHLMHEEAVLRRSSFPELTLEGDSNDVEFHKGGNKLAAERSKSGLTDHAGLAAELEE